MESNLAEHLGTLAAKTEVEAAKAPEWSKPFLTDLANRYREAQFVELRKEIAAHDETASSMVASESRR